MEYKVDAVDKEIQVGDILIYHSIPIIGKVSQSSESNIGKKFVVTGIDLAPEFYTVSKIGEELVSGKIKHTYLVHYSSVDKVDVYRSNMINGIIDDEN